MPATAPDADYFECDDCEHIWQIPKHHAPERTAVQDKKHRIRFGKGASLGEPPPTVARASQLAKALIEHARSQIATGSDLQPVSIEVIARAQAIVADSRAITKALCILRTH
jgi:hypothetical protein